MNWWDGSARISLPSFSSLSDTATDVYGKATDIYGAATGVYDQATGVYDTATDIYDTAADIYDTGVYDTATDIYDTASGVYDTATGVYDKATDIYDTATGVYDKATEARVDLLVALLIHEIFPCGTVYNLYCSWRILPSVVLKKGFGQPKLFILRCIEERLWPTETIHSERFNLLPWDYTPEESDLTEARLGCDMSCLGLEGLCHVCRPKVGSERVNNHVTLLIHWHVRHATLPSCALYCTDTLTPRQRQLPINQQAKCS